jgi:hypothetical protein
MAERRRLSAALSNRPAEAEVVAVFLVSASREPAASAEVDRSSVSVRAEGSPVRRVLTLAVLTDDVVFGIFAASSADVVALVCRRAGMPASRLTAALADRNRVPEGNP